VNGAGIRYARSGDVDVAYEIGGAGPVDVVYVPGFVSHLDLAREVAPLAAVLDRLTRFARVLVLDKRGTGLSSRGVGFGSIAERMDDIRAVMDDAGWERANLFCVSEGGPLSILFAATYPDRVDKLAVFGSYASLDDANRDGRAGADAPALDVDRYLAWLERSWGSGNVISQFIAHPDAVAPALRARFERAAATPRVARDIMRSNIDIDVRPHLAAVSVPALVLHNVGDPVVPIARARDLAAALPDAVLVEYEARAHLYTYPDEWEPALAEVERFLTGTVARSADVDRVLATVLFTDIVDSTGQAAAMGDRRWRTILDRHDETGRRTVAAYGGDVVKQTGDGLLATFDGPARAVRCAQELSRALAASVPIRAGLHTGEVERRGDDVGGIGVHIAARVAALAGPGDVLVSRTVRDLTAGSDLTFEDRGTHELKGVPEAWQLYAATG
jgi:class 3 adenylate cyclase